MGDWYRLGVQPGPKEVRVKYSISTESGSLYHLDIEAKTLERSPAEGGEQLAYDNKILKYEQLLSELTVDTPLLILWQLKDQWKVRSTSPMVEIVRLDVPTSPD